MSSGRFRVSQTPLFGRKVKKSKKNEKVALDIEIRKTIAVSRLALGQASV